MEKSQIADVIILAAGGGTRFGAEKQFAQLGGIPLYLHSLKTFSTHPQINRIILVIPANAIAKIEHDIRPLFFDKKIEIALGGATRQDSVSNGMQKLEELGNSEIVLIHDAARPFISGEIIASVIRAIINNGTALA